MPSDLRFCRNCGFRLADATGVFTGGQMTGAGQAAVRKRRRMSGMAWLFIGLLVFFVGAAAFTAIMSPSRTVMSNVSTRVAKSYIGIDEFKNTDQGVIINSVTIPEGPADKAGLVGGDVILTFDGQQVHNEDQVEELMEKTPTGKTVDVEYMRDGAKKTTKLTTISYDDYRAMGRAFERRPERTQFGYEDRDAERVLVPGSNIYGVKLGRISRSRPADIAGVQSGDIVIEFDGVPIRTEDELLMRVRRAMPYTTVNLVVMRAGEGEKFEKLEIPVRLGRQ